MKKIINYFLLFSVFISLLPVNSVLAEQVEISEEAIFGTLLNASQGGRSRGVNEQTGRLGAHSYGVIRDSGIRLPSIQRGGGKVKFNPSKIDINILYDGYKGFAEQNRSGYHVEYLNQTFSKSSSDFANSTLVNGFYHFNKEYQSFEIPQYISLGYRPENYFYLEIKSSSNNRFSAGIVARYSDETVTPSSVTYGYTIDSDFRRLNNVRSSYSSSPGLSIFPSLQSGEELASITIGRVIYSDYSDITLDDIDFIHTADNMPTKEQFIRNYETTYNVKYDNSTNQLIENNNVYEFNENHFTDNSIVIEGDYIHVEGDYIVGDDTGGGSDSGGSDSSTNFWDFLNTILENLTEIIGVIIDAFVNSIEFIVEKFLSLIIPSTESMEQHKNKMNNTMNDLSLKFNFISEPMQSLKNVYSSPKSLFDVSFNFMGVEIYVLPEMFRPLVSSFKPILNGVAVIGTFIYLYKKIQPDEVIT